MEFALTQAEQETIEQIQTSGTGTIKEPEQIEQLIYGMLKVAEGTYNSIMDAVKEDRALYKAISKRMGDLAKSIVDSNNASVQTTLDTYKSNCEAIIQRLNNPSTSEEAVPELFKELRYYADAMRELHQQTQSVNQEIGRRTADTDAIVLDRSKVDRDIVIGSSIAAGGLLLSTLMWFICRKK